MSAAEPAIVAMSFAGITGAGPPDTAQAGMTPKQAHPSLSAIAQVLIASCKNTFRR